MLADRRYCYPLTITDFASRYLLRCEALSTTQERYRLHRLRAGLQGLRAAARRSAPTTACPSPRPRALRPEQALGLVAPPRASSSNASSPGHPEQNGRHERMHLTLKTRSDEARRGQCPAAAGALRCLRRPLQPRAAASGARHAGARPSSTRPRPRPYHGLADLDYPFHDWTATVTHCGRICFKRRKINLSQVFAGQKVGVTAGQRPHLARHLHGLRFGVLRRRDVPARTDRESVRPESVTHVSGMNCYPCLRNGPVKAGGERGIRTLGRVSPTHAFQACAFNHSAISPSLESITCGQTTANRVRPPNVPRSLTGFSSIAAP